MFWMSRSSLVCVALLALAFGSRPSAATEAPLVGHNSTSVTVLNDVRLKDIGLIPAMLPLDNFFGYDSRVTVMLGRTPFNDRLPGNGKARGRADVAVECLGRAPAGSNLGRFRPRFDADAGVAVQTKRIPANRNCSAYSAVGGPTGNDTQPKGSTVTLDLNVQLLPPSAPSECFDESALCLGRGRFLTHLTWRDARGNQGEGVGIAEADNEGVFYLLDPNNALVQVRVVDGCGINERFWVLYSAPTSAELTLSVKDTETDTIREYFSPLGQAAPAITDTSAFATCP